MAINFILSDRAKTQTIDPTATPQAVATDSSTYTIASLVASVTAEEISGSGYSRPTLTVASNALNVDGVGVLTYNTFTFSASGGDITYNRIALIADSDWLGWLDTGSTTISDGQSKTYQIVYGRGSTGVSLTGQDGVSAFSVTTANYTQPAVSGSVAITLENTGWLAQGCYIYVNNGTNSGFYQVDTVDSSTQITATSLGYTGSAAPTTVITSPAQVIPTGMQGIDGTPEAFTGAPIGYTPTAAGGLAIRTDVNPELIYRTTGISPGNLSLIGGFSTFSGSPASYTPTDNGLLLVKFDVTPNRLFRSTGTGAGNVTEIGGGAGGAFLEYTLNLGAVSAASGELAADGTENSGTPDPITEFYISETDGLVSDDLSAVLNQVHIGSILKVSGAESGVTAYYQIDSQVDSGSYRTWGVTILGENGNFTDLESCYVQFLPSPVISRSVKTSSFSASAVQSLRYEVDASGGNVTITLPQSSTCSPNINHLFKRVDSSVNTVTLSRSGSDLIDGETSQTLSPLEAVNAYPDLSTNWWLH